MGKLIKILSETIEGKKTAILGFGREGQSTYKLLRRYWPEKEIGIFDSNQNVIDNPLLKNDSRLMVYTGKDYLNNLNAYNQIFKSPGISAKTLQKIGYKNSLSTQADVFLAAYASQIIGITGTKGKSTTSSLLSHVLSSGNRHCIFVGNIGIPPFELVDHIKSNTFIVYEMSSHQLEFVQHAPHIAIFLNIFQEHLDHYENYEAYKNAKWRIGQYQNSNDFFIYNYDNEALRKKVSTTALKSTLIPYSLNKIKSPYSISFHHNKVEAQLPVEPFKIRFKNNVQTVLKGQHNLSNILPVVATCKMLGLTEETILKGIAEFNGLPHRLEYVGCLAGKHFYNDSIATIPEATIEAVKTIRDIDVIIIGGYDRGINYNSFVDFLNASSIPNIIAMGSAGLNIYKKLSRKKSQKNIVYIDNFEAGVKHAVELTNRGSNCLLSPAASSYDMFDDFAERGDAFKSLVKKYTSL